MNQYAEAVGRPGARIDPLIALWTPFTLLRRADWCCGCTIPSPMCPAGSRSARWSGSHRQDLEHRSAAACPVARAHRRRHEPQLGFFPSPTVALYMATAVPGPYLCDPGRAGDRACWRSTVLSESGRILAYPGQRRCRGVALRVRLRAPQLIAFLLPFSTLLGTILTLSTMNQNSEIVALKASGLSAHQVLGAAAAGEHRCGGLVALRSTNGWWRAPPPHSNNGKRSSYGQDPDRPRRPRQRMGARRRGSDRDRAGPSGRGNALQLGTT